MKERRESLQTPKNFGKIQQRRDQLTHIISEKNFLNRPGSLSPLSDSPSSGSPARVHLTSAEAEMLQVKLKQISKKLIRMKANIFTCTKNVVEFMESLEKQALNEVLEAEFELNALKLKLEKGEPVDLDLFQMMKDVKIRTKKNFEISEEVKESLAKIFKVPEALSKIAGFRKKSIRSRKSVDSTQLRNSIQLSKPVVPENSKTDDSSLIFAKNYESGLVSLNLDTFEETKLSFAPRILPYHMLCKISGVKYFISGGYDGSRSTGDTFIVDLSLKTFQKLSSSIDRDGAASVLKDEKVFIFGGIHTNEEDLKLCQFFDMKLNSWHDLPDLPIKSHANTASLLHHSIVLTGFHLDGVYRFDGTSYVNLIKIQSVTFKYLFDEWVIDGKSIFKLENFNHNLWVSFNCDKELKLGWLSCLSGFRRGKFVYFVEEINGVLRLDTENKKVEVVQGS
jgi:hypothetical protein